MATAETGVVSQGLRPPVGAGGRAEEKGRMRKDEELIRRLAQSELYAEYEKAFSDSTELPLSLRPVEFWSLPHRGRPRENPFCALLAQANRSCAACLRIQGDLAKAAESARPTTATCFAGLCDTAVPVRLGERTVGLLQTGQVALEKPSRERFRKVARQILEWGAQVDLTRLEDAYFHSKVLSPKQYGATVRLLEIFGRHLGLVANQLAIQTQHAEVPLARRAKAYLASHHTEPLTLREVSAAMHVSTFYFCKVFKKATGMTFTDYLGRVRVERAKNLLGNPHLRVSEIAYAVGFQSLTHFNRVFRQVSGQSPTRFREELTTA